VNCRLSTVSAGLRACATGVSAIAVFAGAISVAQPFRAAPLGRISFPNSGAAAAQAPFIRGVLLLHSFEYDSAIDAFREAERADPSFALAYWGEAMCFNQTLWYNENVAKAREALGRLGKDPAARQAKAPTAREKGYLDAVERLFGPGDKASRNRAYADRMGELSRQFPDDDEAAAFYALALLGTQPESGARDTTVMLEAGAIALGILKKNPQHPGAAHYALHAFDDGEHAAMGLEAARIYAKIAPASSHARHMPSHVFLPLGMWDEAAASDEAAFETSVDLAKRKGLSAAQYDFHSLSWLEYEYLQQGRFTKAHEAMKTVEAALGGSAKASPSNNDGARGFSRAEHLHVESEIGRGYGPLSLKGELASMRARYVIESGRWEEMKGRTSFDNVDELFALGVASVKLGDEARAESAFDQLQQAQKAAPDAENKRLALIMSGEVAGLLELRRGKTAAALQTLAGAAKLESQMARPIARPYPVKPAAELYAEALFASGKPAEAVRAFQASLARTPRRAASLIGLARAAQAAGQRQLALKTAREFMAMWHGADPDRAEMRDARTIVKP
jgi:tetratricopeptide (TPR) repeat protein